MTYMTDTPMAESPVPPPGAPSDRPPGLSMGSYRLRRMGARPIHFQGEELAMAMSFTPELSYWFEINLFRATDGSFPVAIKQFFVADDETDIANAWVAGSLSEAFDLIEGWDPAVNVPFHAHIGGRGMAAAELGAHAMDLQARLTNARTHYRSLVGEFMFELEDA